MAKYKKSNITIDAVLRACKKLFYEKGYTDTHYDDIVSESGIRSGLVHYHFKKKSKIAGIIYNELLMNNKNLIHELLSNKYDLQICTAVEIRNYMNFIFNNEYFKRFYYEIALERIIIQYVKPVGELLFELQVDEYKLPISNDLLKIINISSFALENETVISIIEGYVNMSHNELCEFSLTRIFEFLSIDQKRIKEILRISEEVFNNLNIELKENFQIELIENKN